MSANPHYTRSPLYLSLPGQFAAWSKSSGSNRTLANSVNPFSTWHLHVAWMYIWWVCTRGARKENLKTRTITPYLGSGNVVCVRILICATRQKPCRKRVYGKSSEWVQCAMLKACDECAYRLPNYRRPIFIYRRPILVCGIVTWKMANYHRPHSTYCRPILRGGKAT